MRVPSGTAHQYNGVQPSSPFPLDWLMSTTRVALEDDLWKMAKPHQPRKSGFNLCLLWIPPVFKNTENSIFQKRLFYFVLQYDHAHFNLALMIASLQYNVSVSYELGDFRGVSYCSLSFSIFICQWRSIDYFTG